MYSKPLSLIHQYSKTMRTNQVFHGTVFESTFRFKLIPENSFSCEVGALLVASHVFHDVKFHTLPISCPR